MAKKKKKNSDFQKVKLKPGRKIPKGTNVTRTDFKTKKIVLKESAVINENPISALQRNPNANRQFKCLCLSKLVGYFEDNHGVIEDNTMGLIISRETRWNRVSGEMINLLSKLAIDHEQTVRTLAIKVISQCLLTLIKRSQNVIPFVTILLIYLKCGITHISNDIREDSKQLLEFLIKNYQPEIKNELITTILARIDNNNNLDAKDYELCASLVQHVFPINHLKEKKPIHNLPWVPSLAFCPFTIRKPLMIYNISFQSIETEDMESKFRNCIIRITKEQLVAIERRTDLEISIKEGRIIIACLTIAAILRIETSKIINKLKNLIICVDLDDKKAKTQIIINSLYKKLNHTVALLTE